jgi:hypothetical protein
MNMEELNHKLKKYRTKARYNPENYIYQQKIEYYNNLIGGADIYIDDQLNYYLNLDLDITNKNKDGKYKINGDNKIDIFYLDNNKIVALNSKKNKLSFIKDIINNINKPKENEYMFFSKKTFTINEINNSYLKILSLFNNLKDGLDTDLDECINGLFKNNYICSKYKKYKDIDLNKSLKKALEHINKLIKCNNNTKNICKYINEDIFLINIIKLVKDELLNEDKICENFLYPLLLINSIDIDKEINGMNLMSYCISYKFCVCLTYNIIKITDNKYDTYDDKQIFELSYDEIYFFTHAFINILFIYFGGNIIKVLYILLSIGQGYDKTDLLFIERFKAFNLIDDPNLSLLKTIYINCPIITLNNSYIEDKNKMNILQKQKSKIDKLTQAQKEMYTVLTPDLFSLATSITEIDKQMRINNDLINLLSTNENNVIDNTKLINLTKDSEFINKQNNLKKQKYEHQQEIFVIKGQIDKLIKSPEDLSYSINNMYELSILNIFSEMLNKKWLSFIYVDIDNYRKFTNKKISEIDKIFKLPTQVTSVTPVKSGESGESFA